MSRWIVFSSSSAFIFSEHVPLDQHSIYRPRAPAVRGDFYCNTELYKKQAESVEKRFEADNWMGAAFGPGTDRNTRNSLRGSSAFPLEPLGPGSLNIV